MINVNFNSISGVKALGGVDGQLIASASEPLGEHPYDINGSTLETIYPDEEIKKLPPELRKKLYNFSAEFIRGMHKTINLQGVRRLYEIGVATEGPTFSCVSNSALYGEITDHLFFRLDKPGTSPIVRRFFEIKEISERLILNSSH